MIANGVANKSVADRLTELEGYEKDVITNLEYVKMKKPTLTKEQVVFWLESFKNGDINDISYKRKIVNALIHSIHVYDTDDGGRRIVINFNTSNNNQVELRCSFIDSLVELMSLKTNTLYVLNYSIFRYILDVKSMG